MHKFTEQELEILKKYITNPQSDIFALKNLHGIAGAAFARYSRAKGGFREILLKEFLKEGILDPSHAEELIARILVAFGDDSVGELEGAHMSLENISNLATKVIEDRRIGGSPIEQSSRYVIYDQKDENGKFRYLREQKIMASEYANLYEETLDFVFRTYVDLMQKIQDYFMKLKSIEAAAYDIRGIGKEIYFQDCEDDKEKEAFRKTYTFDIRTKACDTLRCLLPAATLTNVGVFGNGRFFQNLLTKLYSHPLTEMNEIAKKAHEELNKLIAQYVKRAKKNDYNAKIDSKMQKLADEIFGNTTIENEEKTVLLENAKTEKEFRDFTISQMFYPYVNHPLRQIREITAKLSEEKKLLVIKTYIGDRKTRRDRPGRALEFGYPLTFDILLDFGAYRDIQRHRICTQERQRLSPYLGFEMPKEVIDAGFEKQVILCRDKSYELYEKLKHDFREEASYAVLFGFNIRFCMGMNDREAMHLIELRSGKQGHPSYRKLSQKMHNLIKERAPWRAEMLKFVDHNEYFWSRAESEASQRVRERKLEERG